MRKVIILSALTLLLCLSFGVTRSFAGGCTATCTYSSCTVGGCATWGCGCYWGLATCKCEGTSTGTGSNTTKKNINSPAISDFTVYAMNSGSAGLVKVANILKGINNDNYDIVFEAYKETVEGLSEEDKNLYSVYLAL